MFAKGAINGINAAIKEIPTVRVNGNPITKMDNCGAIRFSKPNARFRVSSRVMSGNASISPLRKIKLPALVSARNALLFNGSPPIGRV